MDPVEAFFNRLQHPIMAGIDLSLDRMLRLLSLLGNPHKRLPPVIHVAGTNGKGSLIVYLHGILEAAGYRVHRYTSPHLVRFSERILLQGKEIDNAAMERLLRHLAPVLAAQPVTFFEATTAAAFLAFSESPADVLLLETGMGGRLDATNVVDKPIATVITPISFDHTEFLGNTLAKIAAEKAGIIKRGVPCIVGRQAPEALAVIEQKAASLNAPLSRLGIEWQVESSPSPIGGGLGWGRNTDRPSQESPPPNLPPNGEGIYSSPQHQLILKPALAGEHQFDNAATAIACLAQLPQFTITDAHIAQGLANAVWPARLQPLTNHPYRKFLPENVQLFLDGGHNPQGGEILGAWLAQQALPVYLVCGMIKGKDMKQFLAPLAAHVQELVAVTIPDETNSQPASAVVAAAQGLGMQASAADTVEKALQTLAVRAKTPSIICICGSLYLAGKVLAAH